MARKATRRDLCLSRQSTAPHPPRRERGATGMRAQFVQHAATVAHLSCSGRMHEMVGATHVHVKSSPWFQPLLVQSMNNISTWTTYFSYTACREQHQWRSHWSSWEIQLHCVRKSGEWGWSTLGKWCLKLNLSLPEGNSVNDEIDPK